MSDYIKREDAKECLESDLDKFDHVPQRVVDYLLLGIDSVPSADVVEVRHGRWIEREDGINCYQCSMCHWLVGDLEAKAYVYCPNCGARMDGEEE